MSNPSEILSKTTWNPMDVLADGRVVTASAGLFSSYWLRKTAYTNFRSVYGQASKVEGKIKYLDPETKDANDEVESAYGNRLFLCAAIAITGTLIIGQLRDPQADYFGLGFAAGGFTGATQILLGLE